MIISSGHKSRRRRFKSRSERNRSRSRRLAVLGIVLLAASIAAGLVFYYNLTPLTTTPTEVVVIIPKGAGTNLHLGFEPSKVTIVIGVNNTVIWKNEDSDWHTAHSNIPEFNSGLIPAGGSFIHTFLRAGVFPYHCDPHPWMTGVVTVKSSSATALIGFWGYFQPEALFLQMSQVEFFVEPLILPVS